MDETSVLLIAGKSIFYLIVTTAIILTVLPFFKLGAWWIRVGDFPRIQIAVGCLLAAAVFPFLDFSIHPFEIVCLIAVLACSGYQFYCILPYLPLYPRQVQRTKAPFPEKTVKLFIYNVFIENRNYEKFLLSVEAANPDIILLAEPDERWIREISALEKNYPHAVFCPLDNAYGMALYSRLELINPQLKFLIEEDIPSIHTDVKLASGDLIRLCCLHPRPPIPPENDRSTERDAELMIVGRMIHGSDVPTIVAGDLNDVAWSRTTTLFQKISGLLDPRVGRGLFSSFHAKYPIIRFPLDHVFHSNHFRLVELRRLPSIGSDHFPIYIHLSYEQTAKLMQEEPKADVEEHLDAIEMIKEGIEIKSGTKNNSQSSSR